MTDATRTARRGRPPTGEGGTKIREHYRAFTVRLPPEMYERLRANALDQSRSVAAQIERDLKEKYG